MAAGIALRTRHWYCVRGNGSLALTTWPLHARALCLSLGQQLHRSAGQRLGGICLSCCFLPVRVAAALVARVPTDATAGGLLVADTGAMLLSALHIGGSFELHAAPTAHCLSLAPLEPRGLLSSLRPSALGGFFFLRGQESSKSLCCLFSDHCN